VAGHNGHGAMVHPKYDWVAHIATIAPTINDPCSLHVKRRLIKINSFAAFCDVGGSFRLLQ